jgi:nitroreductase
MDLVTVDHLLTTTRSVRKRLDLTRPVEPEIIQQCIDIALQAPNGGNRGRYHFVVVTDPAQRARLAELYKRQPMNILWRVARRTAPIFLRLPPIWPSICMRCPCISFPASKATAAWTKAPPIYRLRYMGRFCRRPGRSCWPSVPAG